MAGATGAAAEVKKSSHFHVYRDAAGEYRWQLRAPNGRIVADGGEGYKRRAGADRAVSRLILIAHSALYGDAPRQ